MKPRRLKWVRESDEDGPWWTIDIPLGAGIVNIMVSLDVEHYGYTIADGGGRTIREVTDRFDTVTESMRDALLWLEDHLAKTTLLVRSLATNAPTIQARK